MIVYYSPPFWNNLGDRVVYYGLQKLIKPDRVVFYGELPPADTTTLVVNGTPWIWDHCHTSQKFHDLERAVAAVPAANKVAYGIGSCFPMGQIFRGMGMRAGNSRLRALWSQFSTIVTRDRLAHQILGSLGVNATLRHCPSLYAPHGENLELTAGRDVFFVYHAMAGLSSSALTTGFAGRWKSLNQRLFLELENPLLLAVNEHDQEFGQRVLGIKPQLVPRTAPRDMSVCPVRWLLELLATARRIVSGRIHMGLPGLAMGKDVLFLGIDSRIMTAELAGGKTIWVDQPADDPARKHWR